PSSPGGGYDFGTLLAGDINRVEILRGADSVPWGSSAIGGVVNITTQCPSYNLTGGASAEGGSYGTSSLNGHVADTFGPLGIALGGGWYHTSGISAFATSEGGKEADGFDQHYANARATVRLSNDISLDLRGRYARSFTMIDGYNTPTGAFGDDAEYVITREASGNALLHADFGTFKNTLGYTLTNIHRNTYDGALPVNAQFEFGYIGQSQRIEYQGDTQASKGLRFAYGAEHEASSIDSAADIYGDPAFRYTTATDSLYGQAILNPAARLTLTGGLRYDHARSFGGHVTAAANGAWVLGTDTTLRASFAQGFKAPTLYQLYAPFYGTATLRPETANSFDGGIEHIISNNIHLRATYFYRTTHNLIDFDPASFTYSNIARARAHGLELEANGQVARGLILAANYTHSASINPDTGKDLARRPRDVANLSLDWVAARAQGLKFGGTLSYNGPRFDDAANLVPLGSYWLLGARASFPLNAHLELYGRIENALDEQYQVVKHYGTLGRAAYAGVRVKL
ncbi:MAG: TonB-dependent receptor, partial [Alphaproteobacteria bacterium]|nr:TonB-dependent receptor [Alphaproteobacteria bacterium]